MAFLANIQKTKIVQYLFNAIILAAFFILLIYSLINRKIMFTLFTNVSYYLIFLIFIVWVAQTTLFIKSLNFSIKASFEKYWLGIIIALIMTSLVFISVEVNFKTLSDETNLLSVSLSMLNDKNVLNTTMGKYYYGNLNPINREIEKRPLMFPFMLNLLHSLIGFRYQNAFIFNYIVLFLLLVGIYIAVQQFSDVPSSIAAMFLVLSYPVVTIFGVSGGFDLLNSAFFVLLMAASYYFIKNPSSVAFAFIFATLLVFANIRYESIGFLVILPLLLIKKIKWQYFKDYSYLFCIIPLVSLPYLWQRILRPDVYQNPADTPLFSVNALTKNIAIFFTNLIDFKYFLPYAGFVSIASILIFAYLIIEILRRKIRLVNYQYYFLFVLAMSILASTGIYFCHFFGDCTHPSSARFFITLSIILALGPVALKIFKPDTMSGKTILIISIICFLYYHPIAVEGRFINTLAGNRTTYHCMNWLSKINDKNILIISERPGQFTAMGYGAINFAYANKNNIQILKEAKRHLFSKIIVFQEIKYNDNNPTTQTVLDANYKLTTLYEIQITATEFLRISEVQTPM